MRPDHGVSSALSIRALGLVFLLTLFVFAAPPSAEAQPTKNWRIGILALGSAASAAPFMDAFRVALRELGWVEGRTFVLDMALAEGRADRLPALAAQLLEHKVDVIIAGGGNATVVAAKAATKTVPIVMTGSIDAVENGFVQSLAHPGGNITGLSVPTDVGYKTIELLRELNPSLSRIVVFVRNTYPTARRLTGKAGALARFRVILNHVEVSEPADLPRAFAEARALHAGAMIVGPDALFVGGGERMIEFANSARLPSAYFYPEMVEAGGLMCYSIGRVEVWRTAARYVDQMARGIKAADLPVQQPAKLELVINMKTAKSIGVTVPPSVLLRAERVIE
jgi:putative ABC transport system substrate-binding protein